MDDLTTVVFEGTLLKQNRRGRWQKRVFRFDGLLLLCLSPKRQRLPDNVTMLTFEPAKHLASGARTGGEFADALRRFYPTNPPMPALTNPLIASYDNDNGSDLIYTKYYHMPKWIIPTSSISSIRTLVPHPPRDPSSAVARTFIIQTLDRDYVLRAPSAELFSRWTFLLSRMSATGGDHGVLDETRVTANGGMMYTDDDPQFVEAEDEDDDLDDQGPYSATGRGGDPYLSRQQQPPLQHDEFMNSPFITRADQPQPYYAGQQAQYQQPQQQQHQQLNQYRSQQAPPQIDIDITHDALPRLDEWHKSISDLIDRDSAARNSMLTVSAAGSGSLDRPPTIERGKARQSFLGTGPIGSAGILDVGGQRSGPNGKGFAGRPSPPSTVSHPSPLTRQLSLGGPRPPTQPQFQSQPYPPQPAPSQQRHPALPSPVASGGHLPQAPIQHQHPIQEQALKLNLPPPQQQQQRIYLPRPREIPQRELSHAATSTIRLIRRLQGFASDHPAARADALPPPAYILQYACASIPHQLVRVRIRVSERAVEIREHLAAVARGPGPTGYEGVMAGLERVASRVAGVEKVWRDGVVAILQGEGVDVVGVWGRVMQTGTCAHVVDVCQDVRRTYC